MKYAVDRIEGNIAVCECLEKLDTMEEFPLEILPEGIHEGSHLLCIDGVFSLDAESEQEARERIRSKMNRLFGPE